ISFFFSSRRRHTRFSRDWSSDVCSSDLHQFSLPVLVERRGHFFCSQRFAFKRLYDDANRQSILPAELQIALIVRRNGHDGACPRSEEHTSELQSRENLVCRLLLEKKKYS